MMVVYLDLAFFLNSAADALALYVTARLAGLPVRRLRILAAAVLGGAYGAACLLPPLAPAAGFLPQAAVAAGLTLLAFGRRGPFLRRFLLFYLLCCTLGGAMTALSQLLTPYGGLGTLARLNWKVFFLVSVSCYILLSLAFRGGARHALAGELRRCELRRGDRRAELTALLDTRPHPDGPGHRPARAGGGPRGAGAPVVGGGAYGAGGAGGTGGALVPGAVVSQLTGALPPAALPSGGGPGRSAPVLPGGQRDGGRRGAGAGDGSAVSYGPGKRRGLQRPVGRRKGERMPWGITSLESGRRGCAAC